MLKTSFCLGAYTALKGIQVNSHQIEIFYIMLHKEVTKQNDKCIRVIKQWNFSYIL